MWATADSAGAFVTGWVERDQRRVYVPGLALYAFDPDANVVHAAAVSSSVPQDDMVHAYFGSVLPLLLQGDSLEALHASGIRAAGGVVALCARAGTGKSTLATKLEQRGYGVWADDVVVWAPSETAAMSLPLPFRPRLTNTVSRSARRLTRATPLTLTAVLVLERIDQSHEGEEIEVAPAWGSAGLKSVLPHAYSFSLKDEDSRRNLVEHYVHLAATTPIVRVGFRPDLGKIGLLCDTVERLFDGFDSAGGTLPREAVRT